MRPAEYRQLEDAGLRRGIRGRWRQTEFVLAPLGRSDEKRRCAPTLASLRRPLGYANPPARDALKVDNKLQ